jgi:hypothetical protein
MEPALATCVLLAHVRPPALPTRWHAALAVTVVLQALCMGVASVRSSVEAIGTSRQRAVVLLNLRRDLSPGSLLLSDDAGLEFALDGRLIDTPFQTTELIRAGHFPRRVWMNDILAPAIVGVVTSDDILERPLSEVDPFHDRYDPETRVALRDEFILASREAGLYVYRRR